MKLILVLASGTGNDQVNAGRITTYLVAKQCKIADNGLMEERKIFFIANVETVNISFFYGKI
ncbi:hypothetical protein DSCO28_65340 [Desulfosarcina ovata subsp. sediminis]|uniref:Uncharacterized protein n=1 Tax=Desulfosarcina ovata subsp. sediminis TaxID=885957 RepID=A0A5K8A0K7_9BACT|nr:hypothetical protein DSCO28_65340 [Desulfosarcina ovata subsp. sediminis]